MMDIYDEVCDPTEPSKEVIYDNPIGVMSGEDGEAKIMEITPNPAYGTVFTKNERGTCKLFFKLILYIQFLCISSDSKFLILTVCTNNGSCTEYWYNILYYMKTVLQQCLYVLIIC